MAGVKRETLDKKKNNGCVGNRTVGGNVFLCKSDWIKENIGVKWKKCRPISEKGFRLASVYFKDTTDKIFTNQA